MKLFLLAILILSAAAAKAENPLQGRWRVMSMVCSNGPVEHYPPKEFFANSPFLMSFGVNKLIVSMTFPDGCKIDSVQSYRIEGSNLVGANDGNGTSTCEGYQPGYFDGSTAIWVAPDGNTASLMTSGDDSGCKGGSSTTLLQRQD